MTFSEVYTKKYFIYFTYFTCPLNALFDPHWQKHRSYRIGTTLGWINDRFLTIESTISCFLLRELTKKRMQNSYRIQILVKHRLFCPIYTHCATRLLMRWWLWRYYWLATGAKLTFLSSWLLHCRLSEHGFQFNINSSTYSAFPCTLPLYCETWHTMWPSKRFYFSGCFFPFSWRVLLGTEHCGPLWPHVRAVFYKQ